MPGTCPPILCWKFQGGFQIIFWGREHSHFIGAAAKLLRTSPLKRPEAVPNRKKTSREIIVNNFPSIFETSNHQKKQGKNTNNPVPPCSNHPTPKPGTMVIFFSLPNFRRLRCSNCGSERVPRCSLRARKALGP